ncbi:hypothetical protein JCM10207_001344 [Rhodosporidiobolus poonsookiae]
MVKRNKRYALANLKSQILRVPSIEALRFAGYGSTARRAGVALEEWLAGFYAAAIADPKGEDHEAAAVVRLRRLLDWARQNSALTADDLLESEWKGAAQEAKAYYKKHFEQVAPRQEPYRVEAADAPDAPVFEDEPTSAPAASAPIHSPDYSGSASGGYTTWEGPKPPPEIVERQRHQRRNEKTGKEYRQRELACVPMRRGRREWVGVWQ